MKKMAWVVFFVVVCSGLGFAQSINVGGPPADTVWFKGEKHVIAWTYTGSVSPVVNILLVDPKTRAVVHNIEMNTPNDGLHTWNIPLNIPKGKYRIVVKAKGQDVMGVSPGFFIRMKITGIRTPPPPAQRSVDYNVTFSKPKLGDRWYFGDDKDIFLETDFDAQYFWIDLTTEGKSVFPIYEGAMRSYAKEGDIFKYRYRWNIPVASTDKGPYKVRARIASNQGDVVGLSDRFYLLEDVSMKKEVVYLDPVVVNGSAPMVETEPLPLGQLRVGLDWINEMWVSYLAQIKFYFGDIKRKKHVLLSAKLLLTKKKHRTTLALNSCANLLYVLTAPWTDFSRSPRYLYKSFPQPTLGGARYEIDVLQQVRAWISDQDPNYGFLVSYDYKFSHECVTYFGAKLVIEYMYKE